MLARALGVSLVLAALAWELGGCTAAPPVLACTACVSNIACQTGQACERGICVSPGQDPGRCPNASELSTGSAGTAIGATTSTSITSAAATTASTSTSSATSAAAATAGSSSSGFGSTSATSSSSGFGGTSATTSSSGFGSTSATASSGNGGWSWTNLATPSGMGEGESIWGTSPTDFYVGDANGALFHYDGVAFSEAFQDPANIAAISVYESPSGNVSLASSQLFLCEGDCTSSTSYVTVANYENLGCQVDGVCGSGEQVYAVGLYQPDSALGREGCLLTSDGQGNWSVIELSGIPSSAEACAVTPAGIVYATGAGAIESYSLSDGATPETINWPTGSAALSGYIDLVAAWTDGTNTFTTGGDHRVLAWSASGWNLVLNDTPIDPNEDGMSEASFSAIAGAGGSAWAFGYDLEGAQDASFDGVTWSNQPALAPGSTLSGAWAADAANYFVVGSTSGLAPLVIHGQPP